MEYFPFEKWDSRSVKTHKSNTFTVDQFPLKVKLGSIIPLSN